MCVCLIMIIVNNNNNNDNCYMTQKELTGLYNIKKYRGTICAKIMQRNNFFQCVINTYNQLTRAQTQNTKFPNHSQWGRGEGGG